MVIDCFVFFNELDMLEKRLSYMDKYVDYFVLVESPTTFKGNQKPLYFEENKLRFSRWNDKIIHVKTRPLGEGFWDSERNKEEVVDWTVNKDKDEQTWKTWERESQQRYSIIDGLFSFNSDDLILISDIDEIPDMNKIPVTTNKAEVCLMDHHVYNPNYKKNASWAGTIVAPLGIVNKTGINKLRNTRWSLPSKNCGWHLTKFMDESKILEVMNNYSHAGNYDDLENRIRNKLDYETGEKLIEVSNPTIPDEFKI
jgi:beta-1,4-mannosyl-glycoprotein beta-1,4-N-acetylglucosaminyltransferase